MMFAININEKHCVYLLNLHHQLYIIIVIQNSFLYLTIDV